MNQSGFIYGGDYNPEQWLAMPEILEQDIEYMKEAHINEVTLGVFSWSVLEPEEGVYHLEWLEKIMDQLYKNEISVILSTPSAARPKACRQIPGGTARKRGPHEKSVRRTP